MSIKVNSKGKSFAKSLINKGAISTDDWSFSAADGNKLLGPDGDNWANYAKYHLAEDTDAEPETKARYKYPVAKEVNGKSTVFRRGVIAAKSRAAQQGEDDIAAAADDLLQMIDDREDTQYTCECLDCGHKIKSDKHCQDISCPECGGKMRRADRPGPGNRDSVSRADFLFLPDSTIPEEMGYLVQKFEKDKDGFLNGRAIVTNVGVFPYMMKDGTVRWELRPPEEVFHMDSMGTLSMIPVTNNHPDEMVSPENAKALQVGFAGGEVVRDAYHLSVPIKITDAAAIEEIGNGKRGLSCGYKVDLEEKPGVWMGVPYDAIQRNIRYNHIAIVDKGRAGDAAVVKMDSHKKNEMLEAYNRYDAFCIDDIYSKFQKEDSMNLKSIKIDGVEFQAEADVIKALNSAQEKADQLTKSIDGMKADQAKLQAEKDSLSDQLDALKKEKTDLESAIPAKIDEAVKTRMSILKSAEKYGVEVKDEMSLIDVKKAVIVKAFPKASEKLDKADEVYVNARYDSAVEYLDDNADVLDKLHQDGSDTPPASGNPDGEPNADKSRVDMIERMKNASKSE